MYKLSLSLSLSIYLAIYLSVFSVSLFSLSFRLLSLYQIAALFCLLLFVSYPIQQYNFFIVL